jgi:hypothetical protein
LVLLHATDAAGWTWCMHGQWQCWINNVFIRPVADGWFVLREKYCWLVADKPNEQGQTTHTPTQGHSKIIRP